MDVLATTTLGLETIAITEIRELTGRTAVVAHRGMVRSSVDEADIFKLNYCSKSLHRVLLLCGECTFSSLAEIYQQTRAIEFTRLIHPTQSFAVRPKRVGSHAFTSEDIGRVVGQAVIDGYEAEQKVRLKVNLDQPHVIIRAEVRHDRFWISLDTTGDDSLHKRGYRTYQHAAPLKPSIAYSLVRLSGWKASESLLDPMCGSGTICIEASLWARGVPNWFRQNYAFWNLHFMDRRHFLELKREIDARVRLRKLRIRGSDVVEKHVQGARENAEAAGVELEFVTGDATRDPLNADRIVTNPPYGLRVGRMGSMEKLYHDFLANLYQHEWKRTVILTGQPELIPEDRVAERVEIMYGDLPASILILEQ
jgi:tRNA (guanine6-N2)-methyltransferase